MGREVGIVIEDHHHLSSLMDEMEASLKHLNSVAHRISFEHRTTLQRRLSGLELGDVSDAVMLPDADRAFLRAKQELALIKTRNDFFGDTRLFGDPAWTMLLDLYVRQRGGHSTTVSSACIASQAPPTTALRYINTLVAEGWLVRRADQVDARRIYVDLTPEGMDRFTILLARDDRPASRPPT